MRRSLAVAMVGASALLVAGCGSTLPGKPSPTGSSSSEQGSGTTTTSRLAPPIAQQLDTKPYEAKPCDLLRPDQLAQFGVSKPGKAEQTITGASCVWQPDEFKRGSVSVELDTKTGGLKGIYQRRSKYGFFEAGEIHGYPTVQAIDWADAPKNGDCTTHVGVNSDSLIVSYAHVRDKNSPDYSNACAFSDRVADVVIKNLKGGS